jgi:hypothetical protein
MKRRSKYNARKVVVDGVRFDSQAEADYYEKLRDDPAVEDLRLQPEFILLDAFRDSTGKKQRAIKYRADFAYVDRNTHQAVVVEVKGVETPVWKLKYKLFLHRYPNICLVIVRRGNVKISTGDTGEHPLIDLG